MCCGFNFCCEGILNRYCQGRCYCDQMQRSLACAHRRRHHRAHRHLAFLSPQVAADLVANDVNMYGVMMVHTGDADGMVSGAIHTTASTIRPALQVRAGLCRQP